MARWEIRRRRCVTCGVAALFACSLAGQELELRTYAATPVGVDFIAVGYGRSSGNVLMDPALPIERLDADLDLLFLRYTRSFALLGRSAKVKILAPWSAGDWIGALEGEEQIRRRRDSGAGERRVPLEVNFFGAPAPGIGWGNGGQTFVVDEPRETLQSNWRFVWMLAYPITPAQGIVFGLGSALTRRAGGGYDTFSIGYQYAWCGRG